MLEVRDLEIRYGGVPAVRGISLEVGKGEVVGLVGPNGAGKSSTLLAIMGMVAPQRGDVLLDGRTLVGRSTEAIVRGGVSLVPEGRRIFPELTVDENLRLGLMGRRSREGAEADVEQATALFPVVRDARDRAAGLLSGGQQQQLAIARALVAKPDVLLLDEPSLGLAPKVVAQIREIVVDINAQGTSVLLVEQNATMALAIADHGYVMEHGRVVRDGPGAELLADKDIREFYLGIGARDGAAARRSFRNVKTYRRKKSWGA
jgi:branched-chain amino acid transport system ATP-binding protein